MGYKEMYEEWLNNPYFDDATKAELKAIEGNEKEIEDRFYMDLEFGTAGLRGVIGAGTNRMNVYLLFFFSSILSCHFLPFFSCFQITHINSSFVSTFLIRNFPSIHINIHSNTT